METCEICGKQEAENFRFEYGIQSSYYRTKTGTTTEGLLATPYDVYQSKTTYKTFGEDTIHLCLRCIEKRVKVYNNVNGAPIGIGILLFLMFLGLNFKEILDGDGEEIVGVIFGVLVFVIPIYFIIKGCLIRYYSKKMNIDRKEFKQAMKSDDEFMYKRWKDKAEVVYFYQHKKIKPLESFYQEIGKLKVNKWGKEEDVELIVIPAFVHDDTKDPDFKKIYRI